MVPVQSCRDQQRYEITHVSGKGAAALWTLARSMTKGSSDKFWPGKVQVLDYLARVSKPWTSP